MDPLQQDILRLVAGHNGKWFWYQLDRFLAGTYDVSVALMPAIEELAAAGLIEIRVNSELGDIPRYWLTPAGHSAVIDFKNTGAPRT
jgi:hypothetical protein